MSELKMQDRRRGVARFFSEPLETRTLLSVDFVAGPYTTPTDRADTQLGTIGGFVPIEPFIRINPTDPANVVPTSHIGVRPSTTGGATLAATVNFANPPGTNTFNGDTGMSFDSQGNCYWVNMAGTGTAGISVSRINPATGASFTTLNISNNNDDKPFIAADANPVSPFADNVYVVWSRFGAANTPVMFSRSVDQGVTFSAPIALTGAAEDFAWPSGVGVAPNGDVYVGVHANGEGATVARTLVRRSTDGGLTFAAATQAFAAGQSALSYNVQTSGTTTIPGTQFWTQGALQPWVLPDPSRPGNVYVVTNDDPNNVYQNGDDGDVVFARSTDNGATWAQSTVSSGPSNSFQLFPSAAIDQFGNIVVAWYDNRRGLTNAAGRFLLDVMGTYSRDGGLTWAPEFRLNDQAFDPDPGASVRFPGPPPTTRIGEYFGIDVFGGTAHLAWNGNIFTGATPTNQQVVYSNFAVSGALTISGDDAGVTDDSITLRRLAGNNAFIEVLVNGARQYAGLQEAITAITVNGLGGNDTLTIDFTLGDPLSPTGLDFNGGAGAGDRLNIIGAGLGFAFDGSHFTAPAGQSINYTAVETLGLRSGFFTASGTIAPNVVVDSAATLAGEATILGTMTALAGGTVAPGNSGPGILTVGGASFVAGSTYRIDLNGLTPGTQHDQLVVNGTVSLGGATLAVNLGFIPLPGEDIVIIRNDAADLVTGQFAQGSLATFGGVEFAIDYAFEADADLNLNDVAMIRFGAALGPDPCHPGQQALFVSASTGDDVIRFIPATGSSRIEVLINGISEGIFRPSIHGLLIGYGQSGHDLISVEVPSRHVLLYGNVGNDTLSTGNNNGILLGNLGNDHLIGRNQKDILIGGRGADQLDGGNSDDILIAGHSPLYEANTPAAQAALCSILDEWEHGSGGYQGRVSHIINGGGRNGSNVFNPTTVFDDDDVDILIGGNGHDWFLANTVGGVALDQLLDRASGEIVTDLAPLRPGLSSKGASNEVDQT